MNNALLLKQARDGLKRIINENPETVIIYRKDLVDDGFGGLIEDPFGNETPHTIKCRLSHEKKFPGNFYPSPSGFTTNLSRFILVDHKTVVYEGDEFEAIDKRFKIGAVDSLDKFEGVIGYQAPLIEAVKLETES